MQKNIDEIITQTVQGIKDIIDTNTVIGKQVTINDNITIIPLTKVSVGFVGGGGELSTKNKVKEFPFAGVSTSGFSINPIGFISINNDSVQYFDIDGSSITKDTINLARDLVNKISEDNK